MVNLQDKTTTVRGYFDAIARRYDLMNTLLSFGLHHLWKRSTIVRAEIAGGMRVLDVCGGTGDLALLAACAAGPGGRITIYDFSREMMLAGKAKAAAQQHAAPICYVCGDAQRIAVADSSIDTVLIGFGLRNLADMTAGLQEMQRVLKPGGRLVCLEFSQPVIPVFKQLYDLYSYFVIPALGQLITGSREAYSYLPDSIKQFPPPTRLKAMMESAGFSRVGYRLLTGGIAAIHVGYKT